MIIRTVTQLEAQTLKFNLVIYKKKQTGQIQTVTIPAHTVDAEMFEFYRSGRNLENDFQIWLVFS